MNILIVGNGFDLAHGLPTRYADFLNFLMACKDYPGTTYKSSLHEDVWAYIEKSFQEAEAPYKTSYLMEEILACLDDNVWYNYFCTIYHDHLIAGETWIDFESEIRIPIEYFDRSVENISERYRKIFGPEDNKPDQNKAFYLTALLNFESYNTQRNITRNNTYKDLVEKTYEDLQRIVRCLEIYLTDCVQEITIEKHSPDIQAIRPHAILNFNYTDTYSKIYTQKEAPEVHYIHGQAIRDRSIDENNMVLGINEYWKDIDKDTHTNFNLYKKFVQRLMKNTGIEYKIWLEIIYKNHIRQPRLKSTVYIFGHSLDITDGDVLREIMLTQGIRVVVFYRDKQQQAQQIANLSKVLGQDKLLELSFSSEPTIIFKQQREMIPIEESNVSEDDVLQPIG